MVNTTKFQKAIVLKAKEKGITEDFGQTEIRRLKNKHGYNIYGTREEREIAEQIDFLDNWCLNFDENVLKEFVSLVGA